PNGKVLVTWRILRSTIGERRSNSLNTIHLPTHCGKRRLLQITMPSFTGAASCCFRPDKCFSVLAPAMCNVIRQMVGHKMHGPVLASVEHQGVSSPTVHYLLKGTQLNGLSQANMYGDDCNPSTNYPLVRLRCSVTGQVYFARTYDFSTSAVATGQAPQSVRFSAAHITYGHYELYVIANGISSNCISFRHHRLCQACGCKECCREKPDCCCEPIGEKENAMPEPDIIALRSQVHQLSRSTERFGSRIVVEEPHQQPKEVKRDAKRAETRRPRAHTGNNKIRPKRR